MYCGDETGSFIGEIGSHTCRFGYGGEDNPKLTMPSYVVKGTKNNTNNNSATSRRRMSRISSLHPPQEEEVMEAILRMPTTATATATSMNGNGGVTAMEPPITDPNRFLRQGEIVENWDNLQTAWEHGMGVLRANDTLKHTSGGTPWAAKKRKKEHRTVASSGTTSATVVRGTEDDAESGTGSGRCVHPILATMPGVSEYTCSGSSSDGIGGAAGGIGGGAGPLFHEAVRRQQHSRYTELLMESLEARAVFLAPAPMLAPFSLGRQTALVVDIGAGGCRVTPLVDGLVLRGAQRRSGRGGDWLGEVTWNALLQQQQQLQQSSSSSAAAASSSSIKPRYMMRNPYKGKTAHPVFHRRAMHDLMYEIRTEAFVAVEDRDNADKVRIPFRKRPNNNSSSNNHNHSNNSNDTADRDGDGDVTMGGTSSSSKTSHSHSHSPSPPGTPAFAATGNVAAKAAPSLSPESAAYGDDADTDADGDTDGAAATYELPDGTRIDLSGSSFGKDLRQLPELLFVDESDLPFQILPSGGSNNNSSGSGTSAAAAAATTTTTTLSNLPLHKLIRESLLAVGDVDLRRELAGTICLVGATSLLPNLDKRLSRELTALLPSFARPRVLAPKISSVERSCAAWIGASVLTSLGSFQQLWLSRTEYEEHGAHLSIQRFP